MGPLSQRVSHCTDKTSDVRGVVADCVIGAQNVISQTTSCDATNSWTGFGIKEAVETVCGAHDIALGRQRAVQQGIIHTFVVVERRDHAADYNLTKTTLQTHNGLATKQQATLARSTGVHAKAALQIKDGIQTATQIFRTLQAPTRTIDGTRGFDSLAQRWHGDIAFICCR